METIGDRIRAVREGKEMSRDALAKAIGAPGESYVAALELGQIKRGSRLHLIAEVLGVSLNWLETGKGPKFYVPRSVATALRETEAPTYSWHSTYLAAPAATRAVIDLLLLPPKERAARLAEHELIQHCIEQLERLAPRVMTEVKSA